VVRLSSRPGTCCRRNLFPTIVLPQGRLSSTTGPPGGAPPAPGPARAAAAPPAARRRRLPAAAETSPAALPPAAGFCISHHATRSRQDCFTAPARLAESAPLPPLLERRQHAAAASSGGSMHEGLLTMAGCNLRPCSETHHGRSSRLELCMKCVAGSKWAMRSPYRRQPHFDAGRREARRSGARGRAHVCPQGSAAVSQQRLRGQRRFASVAQTRNCCRILSIAPMSVAHTELYLCAIPLTWLSAWLPSQRRSAEHACCAGTTGWAVLPAVSVPTLDAHLLLGKTRKNCT